MLFTAANLPAKHLTHIFYAFADPIDSPEMASKEYACEMERLSAGRLLQLAVVLRFAMTALSLPAARPSQQTVSGGFPIDSPYMGRRGNAGFCNGQRFARRLRFRGALTRWGEYK